MFRDILKNNYEINIEPQNIPNNQSNVEKRTKLRASHFLISKYNTKLQQSKQYGTGIKANILKNRTE